MAPSAAEVDSTIWGGGEQFVIFIFSSYDTTALTCVLRKKGGVCLSYLYGVQYMYTS